MSKKAYKRKLQANSNNVVVRADDFAAALEDILGNIEQVSEETLNETVKVGAKSCRDHWKELAPVRTGDYQASIRYKVDATGRKPVAHAYSKLPGLPHLLEKGHATLGGGYVKGHPHVAPAAEMGFKEANEYLQRKLGESL